MSVMKYAWVVQSRFVGNKKVPSIDASKKLQTMGFKYLPQHKEYVLVPSSCPDGTTDNELLKHLHGARFLLAYPEVLEQCNKKYYEKIISECGARE